MQKTLNEVNPIGSTVNAGTQSDRMVQRDLEETISIRETEPKGLEKLKRDLERLNIKVKIVSGTPGRVS